MCVCAPASSSEFVQRSVGSSDRKGPWMERPVDGPFQPSVDRPCFGGLMAPLCRGASGVSSGFSLVSLPTPPALLPPTASAQNRKPPSSAQFPLCPAPFEPHLDPFIPLRRRLAPPQTLGWAVCANVVRARCPFHDNGNARGRRFVYIHDLLVYYLSIDGDLPCMARDLVSFPV